MPRSQPSRLAVCVLVLWALLGAGFAAAFDGCCRPAGGSESAPHLTDACCGHPAADPEERALAPFRERRAHFVIVSENLEFFRHFHPQDDPAGREAALFEGRFTLPVTFAAGGRHRLVVDFVDEGVWVHKVLDLEVEGPKQAPTGWDFGRTRLRRGQGARLDLSPDRPTLGGFVNAQATVHGEGRPATDLEPFGGALAHFALASEGAASVLHLHGGSDAFGHFQIHDDPPDYRGPKLYLTPQFEVPGRHRLFARFRRGGTEHTVAFDLEVLPKGPGER